MVRKQEAETRKGMRLGKYELGRTLGEGNFGKVKFAKDTVSGQPVAVKIIDKSRIAHLNFSLQIKREIRTLKMLKHPNIVRLHEVLASKTKIYMVMECVMGGELFDRIVSKGKLSETEGRKMFQQLIDGISYCHSKGVFHRDLKLENVLLDAKGHIKITDFGLSALPQHFRDDGLLHTTCGSPNYVAPEVLANKGYDGAASDIWSCGVILITVTGIKASEWFKQDYTPSVEDDDDDEEEVDDTDDDSLSIQELGSEEGKGSDSPTIINAFQLIGMSSFLDLSGFFEQEDVSERRIRFTSNISAKDLLEKIETAVTEMGFSVQKKHAKLKIKQEEPNQKGQVGLLVTAEVFEIKPSLNVVELRKSYGDSCLYRQLYERLLKDVGTTSPDQELVTS
ncbi:unnamed protein product [Eruca vesicaria subsp. sativa]|uniref:non-specific serine/threonine protein kinase n=1 Tax=Eruca vesicaria subsp. sativa TaxID=29727 RepID=A0ABC8KX91_ERUVS|nr:unnamed protein product [Eruca vesicaria subsp. sativa]